MGIETTVMIGLLVAGTATQIEARGDAKHANRLREAAQRQSASEQRASNAAEAARERRQQFREERVRRARILQAAENTGTVGSSGEAGAIGSLSTQLSANIGSNLGKLQTTENMSIFAQDAANAEGGMFNARQKQEVGQFIFNNAQKGGQIGGAIAGSSIFSTTPQTAPAWENQASTGREAN